MKVLSMIAACALLGAVCAAISLGAGHLLLFFAQTTHLPIEFVLTAFYGITIFVLTRGDSK